MVLASPRYSAVLVVQLVLLGVDLCLNSFSVLLAARSSVVLLVLSIVQDIALVFGLTALYLTFFSTFVFKAGLVGLLLRGFAGTIAVGVAYVTATLAYQAWSLGVRWERDGEYRWSAGLQVLLGALQKNLQSQRNLSLKDTSPIRRFQLYKLTFVNL